MAVRKRTLDGKLQIWNDDKLDWVDVEEQKPDQPMQMNLFVNPPIENWIVQWSGSPPSIQIKDFVCGACGSEVDKITAFKGWMCERIDSATGEVICLGEDGIDDVVSIRYSCAKACGWTAKESWWINLNGQGQTVALDIETKEEAIPTQAPEIVRADLDKIFKDQFTRAGVDYFYGDFPGSYSWRGIRSSSGTSGNTT